MDKYLILYLTSELKLENKIVELDIDSAFIEKDNIILAIEKLKETTKYIKILSINNIF